MKNSKVELVLEGLDCANCAATIEARIKEVSSVAEASINIMTKVLAIEIKDISRTDMVLKEAEDIVLRMEPHVVVKKREGSRSHSHKHEKRSHHHSHEHGEDGLNRRELIRLGAGAAIFAAVIILRLSKELEFMLYFISYLLMGGEVLIRAGKNILRGEVFDENFLMGIATVGAFVIGEFAEGVAVMLFYQIGELFQEMAVKRSRRSIEELMDIRPDYANLKLGADTIKCSPEAIEVGQLILVKPGERVPLDGRVVEGSSILDTSALTGESLPREVEVGSSVLAGFINKSGALTIEVERIFGESTVSKILEMVQNASSKKAATENFITKFARYYTPAVVYTALALAIIPPLVLEGAAFSSWFYRALVFLVISCPCALVVSIPLGFFGGIGGASRNGVLIKGGNYLEALNNVETVVFDKTGTLTKGSFKVKEIAPAGGLTCEELLEYAALAESYSNHPIALSILKEYGKPVNKEWITDYQELTGMGVKALVQGKRVLAGNGKLLQQESISFSTSDSVGTVLYIAINEIYAGCIIISDEIKEDSLKAIRELKGIGIKNIVMLTGDSRRAAEVAAKELEITEVYAELLPNQKVERLELLDRKKTATKKLVFVGDGINDAPVLARADIGVAMGGLGSDAAIEAADVVLMHDEPSKLVTAIKIARKTNSIVWQNIIFSFAVKAIVLLLGARGLATMWEAVFADVGVALIAVLNAMRVLNVKDI